MSVKCVSGTIEGHSAATYVGIGFIPDKVEAYNIGSGTIEHVVWLRNFRLDAAGGGIRYQDDNDDVIEDIANRSGIDVYEGGDIITTAAETHKVKAADMDYRDSSGGTGTITKFTMDTAANFTGHFDYGVDTTYIAAGSRVVIDGHIYNMVALSSDGDGSNEVELDRAPTKNPGNVTALYRAYDFIAAPVGTIMPAGFIIQSLGNFWVDSEMVAFAAWKF